MLDIQPRMSFDLNGLKNGCTKNSENSLKSKHSFKDKREVDFKLKLTRLKGPCLDFGFQEPSPFTMSINEMSIVCH